VAGAAGNARLPDAPVLEASGLPTSEARARAGAPVNLLSERLRIAITGHLVYDGPSGGPVRFDGLGARAAMNGPEILIRLDLGLDSGAGEAFGCDLTEAYVRENSEYTT
jgi:glutamate N-acetyltransferase/amino-acid N-acetyltransferase